MPGCSAVPTVGGKRKSRRSKTMRGGNFVGVGEAISPGVLERTAVPNDAYTSGGQNLGPDPGGVNGTGMGGGRRKSKGKGKGKGKKARRSTKRKSRRALKGGAGVVNSAGVGYGYSQGGSEWASGSGYPVIGGYPSRVGGAPMNEAGVRTA
jgi:hypothetical protein